MKYFLCIISFLSVVRGFAQNVQVDSQTYTPQELIEDILIDSNCITNVVVTNVVGGDFGGSDESYGFFNASGTSFPFESGIVMSTGRLANVPGPNTSLSDDDASGWVGDSDLETILNETNTYNATILEFDFTSVASQVSFRYLFASEEYQEGNTNTCIFSDLFGFLIRPTTSQEYENIALVPGTNEPVKVTTVHSGIPGSGGCEPTNEAYFGDWNDATAPINFNGQTAVLTATATIIPNETYHVKLVIADETNFRFDSAVFLEAGSFQLSTDLGPDRLIANNNPLCENEILELAATQPGNNTYRWFRNGAELLGQTNAIYTATQDGTYNVEITLENNCTSYGEITLEYSNNPIVNNTSIIQCDFDQDGLTLYNLYDAEADVTQGDTSLIITNFFRDPIEAQQNSNAIDMPQEFSNTLSGQLVYARVENQFRCWSIAEITLEISNNLIFIPPFEQCDDQDVDGFTAFLVNDIITHIDNFAPINSIISIYTNEIDALNGENALNGEYVNSNQDSDLLFIKIENNNTCYALNTMTINVLFTPALLPNETTIYCLNTFPNTITLDAGIINDNLQIYNYEWFLNGDPVGANSSTLDINQEGTYQVVATYPNRCSSSREIIVLTSNSATIEDISIEQASSNNSITVTVIGEGDYEFALDDDFGPYQDDNIFTNVRPGFHTVYVRDKNSCGITEQLVAVLGFPKYFTPNGDTFNNTWKPFGVNAQFNHTLDIKIFDRYGKLIKQINPSGSGWDGTFNGSVLPNDDYWYLVVMPDGKEYRGHFALVR